MDIYLKKQFYTLLIEKLGRRFFSEKELDLTTEYIRTYLTAKKFQNFRLHKQRLGHWRKNSSFVDTLRGIPSDFIKKKPRSYPTLV